MLYVGNFSYNDANDPAHNYCLMPCIVKADTPEDALAKFAEHFEDIRSTSDLLDGAGEIYLDSLTELDDAPEEALVTQWQKIVPTREGLCSLVSPAPVADEEAAVAYACSQDEAAWETEDDGLLDDARELFDFADDVELEGYDEEPFLTFEPRQA